jgi:hypothetical protein
MKHVGYLAFLLAAALTACSGASSTVPQRDDSVDTLPSPSNLTSASENMRLYVSGSRGINVYKLPITATSTPVAVLKAGNQTGGMNFDSAHRLFVAAGSNTIEVFTQPILNGAVPSFTLATYTAPSSVALDSTGNAVVAEDRPSCHTICLFGVIEVFSAPISKSSTAGYGLDGGYYTVSVAVDPDGNFWTETADYSDMSSNKLTAYHESLSKKRWTAFRSFNLDVHNYGPAGLAFDAAGNMYAPTQNGLEVYQPHPWRKAFTIKASVSGGGLAFGPNGNLYVTTDNGRLLVFSPPFSASSMPRVTLHIPGRSLDAGIAIGP